MRPYYQAWEGEGEDGPWDQGKDEAFQRMMPAIRSNMQLGRVQEGPGGGQRGQLRLLLAARSPVRGPHFDPAVPCTIRACCSSLLKHAMGLIARACMHSCMTMPPIRLSRGSQRSRTLQRLI